MAQCPCCGGSGNIPDPTDDNERAQYRSLQEAFEARGPRSFKTVADAYANLKEQQADAAGS